MRLDIHHIQPPNSSRTTALDAAIKSTLNTSCKSSLDKTNLILSRAKHFESYISTGLFVAKER